MGSSLASCEVSRQLLFAAECQGSIHKNCDMFENVLNTPSLLLCTPIPPMFGDSWYQPTASTWQLVCALVSDNPLAIALEILFHVRSDVC